MFANKKCLQRDVRFFFLGRNSSLHWLGGKHPISTPLADPLDMCSSLICHSRNIHPKQNETDYIIYIITFTQHSLSQCLEPKYAQNNENHGENPPWDLTIKLQQAQNTSSQSPQSLAKQWCPQIHRFVKRTSLHARCGAVLFFALGRGFWGGRAGMENHK